MVQPGHNDDAFTAAIKAGFNGLVRDHDEGYIYHLHCIDAPRSSEPAAVLSEAIRAAVRTDSSMYVWLEVRNPDAIPEYVRDAVRAVRGLGARLVVTQGGACTHGPNATLLDQSLQEAVYEANGSEAVWHPLKKQMVSTSRYPCEAVAI
jgi:Arc/MetJ-type ribon-helix-helix transcriptional regulator